MINKVLAVISSIFLALFLLGITSSGSVDYIKYKVTVSEEVSLTEFLDKYEILEQDRKIFVVRERE